MGEVQPCPQRELLFLPQHHLASAASIGIIHEVTAVVAYMWMSQREYNTS